MGIVSYFPRWKRCVFNILALLTTIPGQAVGSPIEATPNPTLDAIRQKHHLPGLVAARIQGRHHNHAAIIAQVAGVRKFGNDTKMTTSDTFHLGSLTKAMTATLIALLISDPQNGLGWNTTVSEALPHLTGIAPEHGSTSLSMLAAHRAGFNDTALILQDVPLWIAIANGTYTLTEGRRLIAERAFASKPITSPGSSYLYSNLGYMVLGHLVDVHYQDGGWERFIREQLWNPLGMKDCGLGPVPQETPESITNPWPHLPGNPDPVPVPPDTDLPSVMGPAGTAHCTIGSYAKFLSLHLDAILGRETSFLPPSAFHVLHTPYSTLAGSPLTGGVGDIYTPGGWLLVPDDGVNGQYLLHDGTNSMNYAWALVVPGRNESYFIATNVGGADQAMSDVAERLFAGTLGL
ncbi:beta-lactamase/transpeptidase-like protein [Lasiosphaeris hirsuta]|uniref:Beta-lactamase/transpeptidase-like protein n=1 Tax=Lasiosphaeris hirsuta TaxID=260670 RepID=A0AA40DU84_9PEZI|nr:beta-lactamase/transpeptidase-like protein [Lasiosphaeris hirsuta]